MIDIYFKIEVIIIPIVLLFRDLKPGAYFIKRIDGKFDKIIFVKLTKKMAQQLENKYEQINIDPIQFVHEVRFKVECYD